MWKEEVMAFVYHYPGFCLEGLNKTMKTCITTPAKMNQFWNELSPEYMLKSVTDSPYLLTHSMVQSASWAANRFAASQKFPSFHWTRRFITALTSVRHLSLSWASQIQSINPHPTSWRSILILSTHLRLGLPSGPAKQWLEGENILKIGTFQISV